MSGNNLLKRLIDAGMQFTEISQDQAEKLVKEFVKNGQARRKDSEVLVQQLVERGRVASEQFVASVQAEFTKQLGRVALRLDDLEGRVEDIAARLGVPAPRTARGAVKSDVKSAVAAPAEKAPAKKAPAKKAPAKKAPAKKAPAKKAPAK